MEAKDYLRAIRATGLTQVQVSEKTGIQQSTISKIERGDIEDVLSKNYRALQDLYKQVVPASIRKQDRKTGEAV